MGKARRYTPRDIPVRSAEDRAAYMREYMRRYRKEQGFLTRKRGTPSQIGTRFPIPSGAPYEGSSVQVQRVVRPSQRNPEGYTIFFYYNDADRPLEEVPVVVRDLDVPQDDAIDEAVSDALKERQFQDLKPVMMEVVDPSVGETLQRIAYTTGKARRFPKATWEEAKRRRDEFVRPIREAFREGREWEWGEESPIKPKVKIVREAQPQLQSQSRNIQENANDWFLDRAVKIYNRNKVPPSNAIRDAVVQTKRMYNVFPSMDSMNYAYFLMTGHPAGGQY